MSDEKLDQQERQFAERVKTMREARGWTQGQLASALRDAGVPTASQTTISRIENLARPVRLAEAVGLANVFHVGLQALVTEDARFLEIQRRREEVAEVWRKWDELKLLWSDVARAHHRAPIDIHNIHTNYRDLLEDPDNKIYDEMLHGLLTSYERLRDLQTFPEMSARFKEHQVKVDPPEAPITDWPSASEVARERAERHGVDPEAS